MRTEEQIQKLYKIIELACDESYRAKLNARMLSNADELSRYLQSAFDHFTARLDVPFNFMEVSLRSNSIPEDFSDHVLQLAVCIQQATQEDDTLHIFDHMGILVASCIFLDCIRHRKGVVQYILLQDCNLLTS